MGTEDHKTLQKIEIDFVIELAYICQKWYTIKNDIHNAVYKDRIDDMKTAETINIVGNTRFKAQNALNRVLCFSVPKHIGVIRKHHKRVAVRH